MSAHLIIKSSRARLVVLTVLLAIAFFATTAGPAGAATGICESLAGGVIEVEGTGGSGTQPTGYATLGAAFTAINTGVHTGTLVIDVCGNTTEGTATATLNASGSGAASYTTLTISPAGGAARTISGATTAGNPDDRLERRGQRHDRRFEHRRKFADDRQYDGFGDFGHLDDPVHRRRDQQRDHQFEPSGLGLVVGRHQRRDRLLQHRRRNGERQRQQYDLEQQYRPRGREPADQGDPGQRLHHHDGDRQQRHRHQQQQHLRLLRRGGHQRRRRDERRVQRLVDHQQPVLPNRNAHLDHGLAPRRRSTSAIRRRRPARRASLSPATRSASPRTPKPAPIP